MSAKKRLVDAWRQVSPATLLYTPASEPEKIAKLPRFGAEAAILDLEDAVAIDEKPAARITAREGVESLPEDLLRLVRVNNLDTAFTEEDIQGIVCADLDGIVYPKVETAAELWQVDELLSTAERASGLSVGSTILIALIETARGLTDIDKILEDVPARLLTVGFGLGDFSVDMGIELGNYTPQLDYPRAKIAIAARAARLAPAIDGPWLALQDFEGLVSDSQRSKTFGFAGRQLIYPPHVSKTTEVYFGVSEETLEHYSRVITGFEAALAEGKGAVQIDGSLVDYPIYRHAQRVLESAGRGPQSDPFTASNKETK